jgi:hypothetical protein
MGVLAYPRSNTMPALEQATGGTRSAAYWSLGKLVIHRSELPRGCGQRNDELTTAVADCVITPLQLAP